MERISAFEAKTRLSELLRQTEKGNSFCIVRRGKEVARLIPPAKEENKFNFKEIMNTFKEIRKRIPGKMKVRKLIEEGRQF